MNYLIKNFEGFTPKIKKGVYLAPGSQVIGNVTLSENVSVWNNTVIRGDVGSIFIGENTNIQDLSVLHNSANIPLIVNENVTVGHKVTLHSCTIGEGSLIGVGSIILDNVEIGKNCVIGAGSLIPPNKKFEDKKLILGNPARVVRDLTLEEMSFYKDFYKRYISLKDIYLNSNLS